MAVVNDFIVKKGLVVGNTATVSTVDSILLTTTSAPGSASLDLNFTTGMLDPRVTFSRSSIATYVGKDGYIEYADINQPRFDHSTTSTGTCLGLLIEEGRTNLLYSSNSFSTNWTRTEPNLLNNAAIAPDGSNTAIMLTTVGTAAFLYHQNSTPLNTSTYYIASMFFKQGTKTTCGIQMDDADFGGSRFIVSYNWSTGVLTNSTGGTGLPTTPTSLVERYPNGWIRISMKFLPVNAGNAVFMANRDYGGDGTTYLWGAQLEQGTFPTSYIPGTTSLTTRSQDYAQMLGKDFTSWYNPAQGSLYVEFQQTANNILSKGIFAINDGTLNNVAFHGWAQPSTVLSEMFINNVNLGSPTASNYIGGASTKMTQVISTTSNSITLNGTRVNTALTLANMPTVNQLQIGNGRFNSPIQGWIKRLTYYPTALSSATTVNLTSSTSITNFNNVHPAKTYTATTSNFVLKQGVIVNQNLEIPDVDKLYATTLARPTFKSSLNLNFLNGVLDPRILYTRSGLATYVGKDGYIEYADINQPRFNYSTTSTGTCLGLLIEESRTNYFTNATKCNVSYNIANTVITPNYGIAPDGTNTSYRVQGVSSGNVFNFSGASIANTSGTIYTSSIFIKPKSASGSITIYAGDGTSTGGTSFAITIAASGAITINGLGKVEQYGRGWFRIMLPYTATLNSASPNLTFSGTGLNNCDIELWGRQHEIGGFATSFIPSGVSAETRGADNASMSGQNFSSWYRPDQGTLYLEADMTVDCSVVNSYRWPVSINASGSRRYGFYKQPYLTSFNTKVLSSDSISRYEPQIGNIVTGTYFKAVLGLQAGSSFASMTTGTSFSFTSSNTLIPSSDSNQMLIGNGDIIWVGHIRRIIYYPKRLTNAEIQTLST